MLPVEESKPRKTSQKGMVKGAGQLHVLLTDVEENNDVAGQALEWEPKSSETWGHLSSG